MSAVILTSGCSSPVPAAAAPEGGQTEPVIESVMTGAADTEAGSRIAGAAGNGAQETAGAGGANEAAAPVYGNQLSDGVYSVTVDSSSDMFRITSCELIVDNGAMRAVMTMGGTGYLKLYMGTGEEAAGVGEEAFIPFKEAEAGVHTFEVPVPALDLEIACSAFSKNKEAWYDRVLIFRSDSLPADAFAEGQLVTAESLRLEDGRYTAEVILEGGSGRAGIESPAELVVKDGTVFAAVIWSSANYDYMRVEDERFERISTEGNSVFEIPVSGFDRRLPVAANTIAMSQPHEIEYTLMFDSSSLKRTE